MSMTVEPIFLPNKGVDLTKPEQFLNKRYSPYSRNMLFANEKWQGRQGFIEFDDTVLSGSVLRIDQFWKENGTYDLMAFTKKDIYKYDFGNTRYDILTPLYQVGKVKVVNGSAIVRGGLEVDNCDVNPVAWADGSGGSVTPSRNTVTPQDGTAFVRLTVAAGAAAGLLAYHDIASVDLHAYDSIGFWIRSSVATNAGDLRFHLDNTGACASPLETIQIPALLANTWTWVNLAFADPSLLTAVISIGIKQQVDLGACTIDLDQIVVGDWVDQISVGDFFKLGTTLNHTDATWYQVLTVDSDTQITLTAVYAGASANQQTYSIRMCFSGADTDLWSTTEFLDDTLGEILVMTNGVDTPLYYSGTGQCVPLTGLPAGFTTAKYVSQFFNRIIFAWCVEGGQNQPIRIRWSNVGDTLTWDDLDQNDLEQPDFSFWITGIIPYNDYLLIPKESGAYIMRPVDNEDDFDFEFSSLFFGNFAAFSLLNVGGKVHYFGFDNRFRVASLLSDEPVFDPIAPYTRTIDPTAGLLVYGWQLDYRDQIRWMLPYDDVNDVQPMIYYDYKAGVMSIWEYEHSVGFASIGEYLNTTDLYVDDPVWGEYYVDEQDDYWDTRTFLASAPITLYGGRDGKVYTADVGLTDNGETYRRIFDTTRLDMRKPNKKKRLWKQQWWFDAETSGAVEIKIKKNDSKSFDATSKSISLIDATRDIIKPQITWNKEFENAKFRVQADNHFALHGFMNWFSEHASVAA